MWGRYVELVLGAGLVGCPFVFNYAGPAWLRTNVIACGILIILFAGLSFTRRFRSLHRASIAVALWLSLVAYFTGGVPAAPRAQAELICGLLLLMFAIVPSDASLPPPAWRRFHAQRAGPFSRQHL